MFNLDKSLNEYLTKKEERKILELQQKTEVTNKKHEIALKKLDIEMKHAEQGKPKFEENLDLLAMQQMSKSYKDEIVMFLLFTPIGLAFIPQWQDIVEKGFKILGTSMPEWYVYLVSGIVVTIYGLRSLVGLLFSNKNKNKTDTDTQNAG